MSLPILPFAILCGLALVALATASFALFRIKAMIHAVTGAATDAAICAADHRIREAQSQFEAGIQALRHTVEQIAAQVQDVQQQPRQTVANAVPKPGLNLSNRSQALRMHRAGDAPERIAAALEIPRQEVELLIKVHRIVIGSVA